MSEPVSLFAEVTAAADALRRDNPDLREALAEELQLLFREVQKRRMPELSTVEPIELFRVWGLAYAGRCERQREGTIAHINATSEEYARANVPADPFVCPCGAVLNDPLDPAVMAIRQPHYAAAKAARQGREQSGSGEVGAQSPKFGRPGLCRRFSKRLDKEQTTMTAQITADAVPTVIGKRFGAHGLQIACPFCKGPRGGVRYHEHGTGYQKGPWHRLAHCVDRDLSSELRARR